MTADEVIAALDLPAAARVERRVPKTLLLEHGAPTAADKRRISEGIEQLQWAAVLKPTTIGVTAYEDDVRQYLEIVVLRTLLRPVAKTPRLRELVHRAIPYPVFAVAEQCDRVSISLAHLRWSQGEAGKAVLEGDVVAIDVPADGDPHARAFTAALALGKQPRTSLWALYDSWMDVLFALQAAHRTGRFSISTDRDRRTACRETLQECARLDAEMARLRRAAAKEKQMARQMELNIALKRAEAARAAAHARLRGTE